MGSGVSRLVSVLLLFSAVLAGDVHAADQIPSASRTKFEISLGGSINTFDTGLELSHKGSSIRIPFSVEDDLDFDQSVKFGWLSGAWRFADRHRVRFEYQPINRSSKAVLDTDIEIDGDIIRVGARIDSELNTAIYDVNYMYSIYQRPNLEISLTAGIYWLQLEFDLDVSGFVEPADGSEGATFRGDFKAREDLDAPLPLLGVRLEYQMTERWNLNLGARYLDVEIGDVHGRVATLAAGADFRFSKYLSAGLSVTAFDLRVEEDTNETRHVLKMDHEGIQVYLVYRY